MRGAVLLCFLSGPSASLCIEPCLTECESAVHMGKVFCAIWLLTQFSPLGSQVKKQRPILRMEGSQLCCTHGEVPTVGLSVREGGPELGLPDKRQDTQSHLDCR